MKLRAFTIGNPKDVSGLRTSITLEMKPVIDQLNNISEGQGKAVTNATTAPPAANSTTKYGRSDFIKNSEPTELGADGEKYIVFGWICVEAGTPGVFKEMRCLTGG